jgi:hypothetical protein
LRSPTAKNYLRRFLTNEPTFRCQLLPHKYNRDRKLTREYTKPLEMNDSDHRERNYGAKCVKFRVEVQQCAASTTVKDMKTITQNKTINSIDYDLIGSTETDTLMNGI